MEQYKLNYITKAIQQAEQAGHIFPTMAACEAALESGYGTSGLSIEAHNEFGTKQHVHPIYGTINLPTKEYIKGEWSTVLGLFVRYPDQASCFTDRMTTLKRLAPYYHNYAEALAATDPITYIRAVSGTWSTDPERAEKVIAIYAQLQGTEEQEAPWTGKSLSISVSQT